MWTMLGWVSWAASFASSMNMLTNSALSVMCEWMRLMATVFWNPSTPRMRAFHTSAMPPAAMRSSSVYWPKRSPGWSPASSRNIGMRWVTAGSNGREVAAAGGAGGGDGRGGDGGGGVAARGSGWTAGAAGATGCGDATA